MSPVMTGLLLDGLWETLFMVGVSGVLAAIGGVPIGIILVATGRGHIWPSPVVNRTLGMAVNAFRSTPFIILMIAIIPLTRLIVGTSIGTAAAIVPLTVAAVPFVARLAESSLREVDPGLIEAAQAMGASPWQIVVKVLVPEAWPGIVAGITITLVNLVGYSAMAGAIGGGGLGDLGIRYGYQRFQPTVMVIVVIVLILLVQGLQSSGDWLSARLNKRLIRFRGEGE
jgi:D-methionine transport system permease protein